MRITAFSIKFSICLTSFLTLLIIYLIRLILSSLFWLCDVTILKYHILIVHFPLKHNSSERMHRKVDTLMNKVLVTMGDIHLLFVHQIRK